MNTSKEELSQIMNLDSNEAAAISEATLSEMDMENVEGGRNINLNTQMIDLNFRDCFQGNKCGPVHVEELELES